jgi:hypothetical protein
MLASGVDLAVSASIYLRLLSNEPQFNGQGTCNNGGIQLQPDVLPQSPQTKHEPARIMLLEPQWEHF